jgi:hypothetical protein
MAVLQLELPLISEDPDLRINRAIERMQERFDKNRKSLHAKNSELLKITYELQEKVSFLEKMLCQHSEGLKF